MGLSILDVSSGDQSIITGGVVSADGYEPIVITPTEENTPKSSEQEPAVEAKPKFEIFGFYGFVIIIIVLLLIGVCIFVVIKTRKLLHKSRSSKYVAEKTKPEYKAEKLPQDSNIKEINYRPEP